MSRRGAFGAPHDRLLRAVGRYHYLTAKQLTQLLYAPSMLRDVQRWAAELALMGYVVSLAGYTRRGRPPAIYTLDRPGRAYVAARGIWIPDRFKPAERRKLRHPFFDHTLALNDVLISLERLARADPRLRIDGLVHEQRFKREPIRVALADGTPRVAEPDAWVDLTFPRPNQTPLRQPLLLELDRGTEEQDQWRAKVRTLLAFVDGPYQAAFRTRYATVAVVAADPTGAEARRDRLLAWTAAELRALGRTDAAELFLFSAGDAVASDPAELWRAPSWRVLTEPDPVPLLQLPEGGP